MNEAEAAAKRAVRSPEKNVLPQCARGDHFACNGAARATLDSAEIFCGCKCHRPPGHPE